MAVATFDVELLDIPSSVELRIGLAYYTTVAVLTFYGIHLPCLILSLVNTSYLGLGLWTLYPAGSASLTHEAKLCNLKSENVCNYDLLIFYVYVK